MQIDLEDFKRHYAMLSDDALLEIDRNELVDAARACYDAELAERNLARPDEEENASALDHPGDDVPGTKGGLELVATFLTIEEANFARGLLQSADIPCSFENDEAAAWTGMGELRLMVPASAYDRACEILDTEISEEDLIAQAEAEAAETPDASADDEDLIIFSATLTPTGYNRTSDGDCDFMEIDWFPLWLSLRVAVLSTALAFAGGLWIAYLLANRQFRGKDVLDAAVTLPFVLPPTVLGYYLLVLLGRASPLGKLWEAIFGSPLVFTWKAAVVAALLHALPLLVKSARAALESVDRSYERAARNLGASEWKLFWRVTMPLAWRSILAATALAFARSLGDFGVTLMVAGNIPGRTQTVAVAIYEAVESGNGALARTLVLIVSAAALLLLTLANRLSPSRL